MTQHHLLNLREGNQWLVSDGEGGTYPVCSIRWDELQRLRSLVEQRHPPHHAEAGRLATDALRVLTGMPPYPSHMLTALEAEVGRHLMDAIMLLEGTIYSD